MHNTSQMAFNPSAGLVLYPPHVSGRTLNFQASDKFTETPGAQNFGLNTAAFGAQTLAKPPSIGPVRQTQGTGRHYSERVGSRHSKRALVCGRWRQSLWRRRVHCEQSRFSVTPQGRLRAYSADKGIRLLDIPIGETAGLGPPITYMHNGKQYVALMGGQGQLGGLMDCPLVARLLLHRQHHLAARHLLRRRNPASPHHSAAYPLFHLQAVADRRLQTRSCSCSRCPNRKCCPNYFWELCFSSPASMPAISPASGKGRWGSSSSRDLSRH